MAAVSLSSGPAYATPSDAGQLQQIYQQGMQGGSGGAYGYYVKQAGGPVVMNDNEGYVYDPASALKTLYLAYAMRQVAAGSDSLDKPVTVYSYPHNRNGLDPANKDLCPNPSDELPSNAASQSLQTVLSGMMLQSDNRMTRAIELRYGRSNLNSFAAALGMGSTAIGQIMGCGDDNGLRNTWTLGDAGRLYEAADQDNATVRQMSTQLDISFFDVIGSEADALGISDATNLFANGISIHVKGGAYDICHQSCVGDTVVTRDVAGILSMPIQSPKGLAPIDFVFGSFITGGHTSCPSFPCQLGTRANAAVQAAVPEMFRSTIRAALQSWAALTTMTAGTAVYVASKLRVSASLSTKYGRKHPAGQSVRFAVRGRLLCSAKTDSGGKAVCAATAPKGKLVSYTATFAGGNGLFAASTTGRIPGPRKKK